MADARNGIVLLNGSNFPTWKLQCRMVLMKQGVWKIVNGMEVAPDEENIIARNKFNDRRDKALSTIVLAVETSLLYLLGDPQDPVEVWNKLCDQFQAKTWANKLALRRKLYGLKLKENQSVQEHLKAMVEIFDNLAVIGEAVEEEDRVVHILTSLPESYNMLVTAFEASSEVPKIEIVTEKLLNEERKIKEKRSSVERGYSGDALFVASTKPKTCFYCGETGHIKRFCEKWIEKTENENKKNRSPAVANFCQRNKSSIVDSESSDDECIALVSEVSKENKDKWIVDSAASRHMCNDRKQFKDLKRLDKGKEIRVGDGSLVRANFEGTIKLRIRAINQVRKFKLRKVLFVPELKYNLLSVSQASESGKNVHFDKNGAQIKDVTSQETVGTATKDGKIYYLNVIVEKLRKMPRIYNHNKDMEKAFLSMRENNFKQELMKRLDKIEEDKLILDRRIDNVEKDYSQSYAPTKEDRFQNERTTLKLSRFMDRK